MSLMIVDYSTNYGVLMLRRFTCLIITVLLMGVMAAATGHSADALLSVDVSDFGAKGDGNTKDTKAIQDAINYVSIRGGGEVRIPGGKSFLSGSLVLLSKVTLRFGAGSTILGSSVASDYPIITARWEGRMTQCRRALISADRAADIAVVGPGAIRGSPQIGELRSPRGAPVIEFMECDRVLVEDVALVSTRMWTLHPVFSRNVTIRNVNITGYGVNADGVDIDSCRWVLVDGCTFKTDDDGIAIKSGKGKEGASIGRPSEDITITNCTFNKSSGYPNNGLSGIACGSECSGGIQRIRISHCTFNDKERALYIKTGPARGGYIQDILADHLTILNGMVIRIKTDYTDGSDPANNFTGLEGITVIKNIRVVGARTTLTTGTGRLAQVIATTEKPIDGLELKNLTGSSYYGMTISNAKNVLIADINEQITVPPLMILTNVQGRGLDGKLAGSPPTVAVPASANPDVVSGATTILSVLGASEDSEPSLTYTWSTTGTPPAPVTFSSNGTNAAKTTTATLSAAGTYQFKVTITDLSGLTTTSSISVTKPPGGTSGPTIATQPASVTVTVGQTATFVVGATGNPAPTFQWQKGTTNISGATLASYTTPATVAGDSGSTYRCVVTNSVGTVTSNAATLTVNAAPTAPVITTQPTSKTVAVGQTATFTVVATGNPAPTYQWQKGTTNISGATSASYTTPATVAGDSGSTYRCVVANSVDTVTSNAATLTVNAAQTAPVITTQPTSITVTVGQTATFTVVATGNPAPTYQWQKGTTNISGATSGSYTTPATVAGDSGTTYRCVVKNSVGEVTSQVATLTISGALPNGWMTQDVGAVAAAGRVSETGGTWTLLGSGKDIWGAADEFRFVWRRVDGDVRITARVASLTHTRDWSKAGVMVRESLAAGSRHAFTCVTPAGGLSFQRRLATDGPSALTAGPFKAAPYWLRLERIGTDFISAVSADGITWKEIRRVTITMGQSVLVGLALTSQADGVLATGVIDNVEITAAGAASN
jgi:regulation of enolase protein 1 (concanavalin A-like superfamily)